MQCQNNALQCNATQCQTTHWNANKCNARKADDFVMQCNAKASLKRWNTKQHITMKFNAMQCQKSTLQCNAMPRQPKYHGMQSSIFEPSEKLIQIAHPSAVQCQNNTSNCTAMPKQHIAVQWAAMYSHAFKCNAIQCSTKPQSTQHRCNSQLHAHSLL